MVFSLYRPDLRAPQFEGQPFQKLRRGRHDGRQLQIRQMGPPIEGHEECRQDQTHDETGADIARQGAQTGRIGGEQMDHAPDDQPHRDRHEATADDALNPAVGRSPAPGGDEAESHEAHGRACQSERDHQNCAWNEGRAVGSKRADKAQKPAHARRHNQSAQHRCAGDGLR